MKHEALIVLFHHIKDKSYAGQTVDNICFRSNVAVLIDFDYACDSANENLPLYGVGSTVSCMFRKRTKKIKTAEHLDWMQLGWMSFWIHNLGSMNDVNYHDMDDRWSEQHTCPFLEHAVNEGGYSRDLPHKSPIYTEHMEHLASVLSSVTCPVRP